MLSRLRQRVAKQWETRKIWVIFWLALILVLLAWTLSPFFIGYYYPQLVNAGGFADSYGAINALFSGLAFAILIFTMLLQKQELEYQREELKLTRMELAGQKEQLAAQNKTLRQQTLESTFFSLLDLLNEIINSIDLVSGFHQERTTHGRDCFTDFYLTDFKMDYNQVDRDDTNADEPTKIRKAYQKFVEFRQSKVGHYHRTLYRIIKFVELSDIDPDTKKLYAGLLRAQLSSYQLALLFYNCLHEVGEKFKPYVVKYSLLKNMQPGLLLKPEHSELYDRQAFGD